MTTGQRMKARRKEIGLSAERIAELLGVSPATIYRYENGDIEKVPGDRLKPIAEALQTTPQALMGWEESPQSSKDVTVDNKKAPIPQDERPINDDDIKFALWGTREIDDDVLDAVKTFAKFARENRKD